MTGVFTPWELPDSTKEIFFSSTNRLGIYQHSALGNTVYSKPYLNDIIDTQAAGRGLSGNMDSGLRNMTGF